MIVNHREQRVPSRRDPDRSTGKVDSPALSVDTSPASRSKAIPLARDRMQSELVAGALGLLLAAKAVLIVMQMHREGAMPEWFWAACGISAAFALVAWLLRAATGPAAAMGGLVCQHVLMRQELGVTWEHTAVPALLTLFLLTFAATKFGRSRKEAMGIAEGRKGRRASQVLANLGVAGLFAASGIAGTHEAVATFAACIAALAEATADTVSSEMGQALAETRWGRPTLLILTGKPVPPGTDGGVTIAGTALGMLAAAVVVLLSSFAGEALPALCIFAAACAGLLFDSLLGATLEHKGWLGNDLVNLSSTMFAAGLGFAVGTIL